MCFYRSEGGVTVSEVPDFRLVSEVETAPFVFFVVVEESADMTRLVELGTSKRHGSRSLPHSAYPPTGYRAAPQLNKDAPLKA